MTTAWIAGSLLFGFFTTIPGALAYSVANPLLQKLGNPLFSSFGESWGESNSSLFAAQNKGADSGCGAGVRG